MQKSISHFFRDLGFPLRNTRWSWGARDGGILLLRTWADEFSTRPLKVVLLDARYASSISFGLDERLSHLEGLWAGSLAGYIVVATAENPKSNPRKISHYRGDVVFPISQLEQQPDGSITANLTPPVVIEALREHAMTHRTGIGEGEFPIGSEVRSGASTRTYQEKLPAVRQWLIQVSRAHGKVTYSEVMERFGLTYYPLRNAMSRVGKDCQSNDEPILTALIVDKDSGLCSTGLYDEFGVADDEAERLRCYQYWAPQERLQLPTERPEAAPIKDSVADADFEKRAARFAQVEVRTQQSAFRNAVFQACQGRCVVTGCPVPEALEAAHLHGRNWREGHNTSADGLLLRRDLHTLYDKGLMTISLEGRISFAPEVMSYYATFDQTVLSKT